MKIEILETQGVTKPQGLYNHAISVSAGRLLFILSQKTWSCGPGQR
jgi:hypothetical protein